MPSQENAAPTATGTAVPTVKWDDSTMNTLYANVCNVTGTREEVALLFGTNQTLYTGQKEVKVKLSNRVVLSPYAAKRLQALLAEVLRRADRSAVRVLHDRGHARPSGRRRPRWEVLALGCGGIHQVDVRIDHPRKDEEAGGVDTLGSRLTIRGQGGDGAVANVQVESCPAFGGNDRASLDPKVEGHVLPGPVAGPEPVSSPPSAIGPASVLTSLSRP